MIYYRIDLPGGVSTSILIDFVKENQPKSRSISPKIEKWRSAGVPAVVRTLVFLSPIPGQLAARAVAKLPPLPKPRSALEQARKNTVRRIF